MFAADEEGARDLLLTLLPQIEEGGRHEVFALLGWIYLTRGANDAAAECIRSLDPGGRQARFLRTGLRAASGEHDAAAAELALLADEQDQLLTHARVLCARALGEDDLHVRAAPLWEQVIAEVAAVDSDEAGDHLLVIAGTGYGRFCVETGRLAQAQPWLHRAGARAEAHGWELATARTQLERAAASWSAGDHLTTEQLTAQAYPVIARYARADDVSRCWLFFGLTRMGAGALEAADQCWEHAERHWRELGRPLPIHRILLQRSWIPIFLGRYAEAVELVARARDALDSWPRAGWLQYARLDDHLGTIWRADALADLGFDGAGDPEENWQQAQARQATALGVTYAETGSAAYRSAQAKLAQAADLKVPAALAVDSVRYSIADADARARWATRIAAPILAGAFAVAWEADNTELVSELIEYHSARGTFTSAPQSAQPADWTVTATAVESADVAMLAAGPQVPASASLTRMGPLPPLQMQPGGPPILARYREMAEQRYHRDLTAAETAWSTWP
jgi:tetratricopeptide (TPR) repeat protein